MSQNIATSQRLGGVNTKPVKINSVKPVINLIVLSLFPMFMSFPCEEGVSKIMFYSSEILCKNYRLTRYQMSFSYVLIAGELSQMYQDVGWHPAHRYSAGRIGLPGIREVSFVSIAGVLFHTYQEDLTPLEAGGFDVFQVMPEGLHGLRGW